MMKCCSLLLISIFSLIAINAYAEIDQGIKETSDGRFELHADGSSWSILFPKSNMTLQRNQHRNNGKSRYFHFSSSSDVQISFIIEPVSSCLTSVECRNFQSENPSESMKLSKYKTNYEINEFAIVEYFIEKASDDIVKNIPALKDKNINQNNINAHYVNNGYRVDLHISKMFYSIKDKSFFSDFIKSIEIMNR